MILVSLMSVISLTLLYNKNCVPVNFHQTERYFSDITATIFPRYVDINECAVSVTNECTQRCDNTPGSYRCSCDVTGYVLDNDGFTCSGKLQNLNVAKKTNV